MEYHERADIYFSILYFIFVICFVVPPREFAAAGITIQNIFSSYLGSEDIDFIGYHVRRTSVTALVHSFLPLLYYFGLGFASPEYSLFTFTRLSSFCLLFSLFCFGAALLGILVFILWTSYAYKYHPLVADLSAYGSPWRAVAGQINLEFRSLDKFSSILGGTSIYVTDSWIMKCTTYKVHIAQQTDCHLSIVGSEDFVYNHDSNQSAQFLQIRVSSIPPHQRTFDLHVNAVEYQDMKDRLSAPIRNARNVVINQSLSDRFLNAFREQVEANGRMETNQLGNSDLENCIGCMAVPANIKLAKRCGSLNEGECQQCYCRPMWCLECMGRWFASRQDQNEPNRWMSSLAPCPTCRSKFCMLDVFRIQ